LLAQALGTVVVTGNLRGTRGSLTQIFFEWIAEMPAANDAQALVEAVGRGECKTPVLSTAGA
jgi:hypothetical protein